MLYYVAVCSNTKEEEIFRETLLKPLYMRL